MPYLFWERPWPDPIENEFILSVHRDLSTQRRNLFEISLKRSGLCPCIAMCASDTVQRAWYDTLNGVWLVLLPWLNLRDLLVHDVYTMTMNWYWPCVPWLRMEQGCFSFLLLLKPAQCRVWMIHDWFNCLCANDPSMKTWAWSKLSFEHDCYNLTKLCLKSWQLLHGTLIMTLAKWCYLWTPMHLKMQYLRLTTKSLLPTGKEIL